MACANVHKYVVKEQEYEKNTALPDLLKLSPVILKVKKVEQATL